MEPRVVTATMDTTQSPSMRPQSLAMGWKNCAISCMKKACAARRRGASDAPFVICTNAQIAANNIRAPAVTQRQFHVVVVTRRIIPITASCYVGEDIFGYATNEYHNAGVWKSYMPALWYSFVAYLILRCFRQFVLEFTQPI